MVLVKNIKGQRKSKKFKKTIDKYKKRCYTMFIDESQRKSKSKNEKGSEAENEGK